MTEPTPSPTAPGGQPDPAPPGPEPAGPADTAPCPVAAERDP
jgi:hypothetical protein